MSPDPQTHDLQLDPDSVDWPTPEHPIRTDRLLLRPHTGDDLADLLVFHSDPAVVEHTPWPVRDRAATEEFLATRLGMVRWWEPGDWMVLAIELAPTGRVVGEVLLKWDGPGRGELGFALAADQHGTGVAYEAARAVLTFAFADLGLQRVTGVTIAENAASARLLERLGMRLEDGLTQTVLFKGRRATEHVYAVSAADWARPKH